MVLTRSNFLGVYVSSKFGDAIAAIAPLEYVHGEITGNPITGVEIQNIAINSRGNALVMAEKVFMRADIASVLSEPKLAILEIVSPTIDIEQLKLLLDEMVDSGGAPAVEQIRLKGLVISQDIPELEDLHIHQLDLVLSSTVYDISFVASHFGRDIEGHVHLTKDGDLMDITKAIIMYGKGKISISGRISSPSSININVERFDIRDLPVSGDMMSRHNIDGAVDIEGHISSVNPLSVSGSIYSDRVTYDAYEMKKLSAKFEYDQDNTIAELTDLKFEISDLPISARLCRIESSGGELAYKVHDIYIKDVDLSAISNNYDLKKLQLTGKATIAADLAGVGPEFKLYPRLSSGDIYVGGVRVSPKESRLSLSKNMILSVVSNMSLVGGMCRIEGETDLSAKDTSISAHIAANGIELSQIKELVDRDRKLNVKGKLSAAGDIIVRGKKIEISADINSKKIVADGIDIDDVLMSGTYTGDRIAVKQLRASLFGGEVEAEGNVALKKKLEESTFCFTGNILGLSAEDICSKFRGSIERDIKGIISGEIDISDAADTPLISARLVSAHITVDNRFDLLNNSVELSSDLSAVKIASIESTFAGTNISGGGEFVPPAGDRPASFDILLETTKVDSASILSSDIANGMSFSMASSIRLMSDRSGALVVRLAMKDADFSYDPYFSGTQFDGEIEYSDQKLDIIRLENTHDTERISIAGSVIVKDDISSSVLDLDVRIGSADIGRISRIFVPESKGYEGFATGHASINGRISAPRIRGEAAITHVRAFGLFLPKIELASISSDLRKIEIPDIKAFVGHGNIDADCTIELGAEPRAVLSARGKSVDIRSVTYNVDREIRRELNGSVDFNFNGSGWLDSFSGTGSVDVPHFKGMGFKIDDFSADFMVSDGFVLIEDSSATAYGGELRLQMAKDLHLTRWGGRFILKSADLGAFLKDAVPDMGGEITGIADLALRIGGDSTRTSLQDADGTLDIKSGDISGFKAIESLSKISGGKNIAYNDAHFPFSVDGKTIYLLPGARITAPSRGNIFKYIALDGNIAIEDQRFSLSILGNINIRALNFMVGGLQSIMTAAVKNNAVGSTNEVLQNFLGGAITGFSKNEFRDISMVVSGDADNFTVSKLLLSERQVLDARPDILSKSDEQKKEEEHLFKLKVEFPVGPGGSSESGVAGQVSGQILEQAIKSLFKR